MTTMADPNLLEYAKPAPRNTVTPDQRNLSPAEQQQALQNRQQALTAAQQPQQQLPLQAEQGPLTPPPMGSMARAGPNTPAWWSDTNASWNPETGLDGMGNYGGPIGTSGPMGAGGGDRGNAANIANGWTQPAPQFFGGQNNAAPGSSTALPQQQSPTLPPQIGQQKFGNSGIGSLGGGGQTNVSLNLQGSATMNPQGADQNRGYPGFDFNPGASGAGASGQMRLAKGGLASLGRGKDTMLVHMTPGEVASLQKLAMSHGGSLTINPQTGFPEAGFLSSILPIVAGAALTPFVGPMGAALITGGIGALATGSLGKGLMMGLGAYGGAGLGSAFSAAGAAGEAGAGALTNATAAATTTNNAANIALQQVPATAGYGPAFEATMQNLQSSGAFPVPPPVEAPLALTPQQITQQAMAAPPSFGNAVKGFSDVFSGGPTGDQARDAFMQNVGGGKGLAKYGLAAAAPMLYEGMQPKPLELAPKQPYQYYKTSYSQQRNPLYGQPGEPYFIQSYGPGSFTTDPKEVIGVRGGGLMTFADGGYVPESGKFRIPAPGAEGDESRTPKTSFEFGGYAPDKGNPLKNMSELQLKIIAARSKDPELKGRAVNELYVRQSTASPSQGFMSAEDFAKGAARGGLMSLADGGAVPTPALPAQAPPTSPLLQQVQTPPPDALNNYLANLGQSLMGAQPQPSSFFSINPAAIIPSASAFSLPGAVAPAQTTSSITQQYTFNPTTQTFGINPNYVAPVAPVEVDGNGGDEGNGDAAGGPIKAKYAAGGLGSLPEYAAGGKLLDGPGDGVSDSIPAVIKGPKPQRAALADGEFVIPARIVSELGNGSTKAGAKRLYAMMDRVQNARRKTTGKNRVAVNTRPDSLMPA